MYLVKVASSREAGDLIARNAFSGGADSFADPLASASQADSYGIGLNWYLNENLKWLLDVEHTTFEGGSATGDRKDEDHGEDDVDAEKIDAARKQFQRSHARALNL